MVKHHPAGAHGQPRLALMIEVPELSSRSKPGKPSMWQPCELTLVNPTNSSEKFPDPARAPTDPCSWPAEQVDDGGGGTGNENESLAFPSGPPFGYVASMTEKTGPLMEETTVVRVTEAPY